MRECSTARMKPRCVRWVAWWSPWCNSPGFAIAPPDLKNKAQLFLNFAEKVSDKNVPDPYWSGPQGFEQVIDLIEQASQGLLHFIRKKWEL